ncbi:MAG: hypothetical protein A3A98_01610 [Candidatus Staskawiczbacteria bacterium RIFCSPLOWO2_01_FULL_40_39]|uniref:Baseplate protein J-like barrel domain-containing protein n=1 Tax=Candidatus Staskawiczbacteria bacterium RIFCSPHIGHO2_01_FULL_39_25 TaxID=1802202 RepID=A0A1G2HQH0_9BACT|nr:MAG: hypothetical protein A2730_01765 [Candidatus Staskawiczbacteria bacterium RIFCSPHIGHO2_01_FULL_39_25]OGZ72673.1 MAG: hypothetical protein A3A98_01610 [Candidatus Staskawiczbacteria bacterium RIFCSPLOWO2_01_FULL_40_39]OGZ74357.1 MAG: hypothetical protein A3I87_01030 [Candidatus Staskawiczbacteria bacterium RIFCSPLOWO2_02_FULL_39_8]
MAKKIYDILPPNKVNKPKEAVNIFIDHKKKRTRKALEQPQPIKKRFALKEILVGGGIIVFLCGIYLYNVLQSVQVEILPKLEVLALSEKVMADISVKEVDIAKKMIPAQYFSEEKSGSREFDATGSASNEGKATGTIKIYNKISPSTPFVLKAGTHFLSDSGKYFVTLERLTIPAGQKNAPGSISAKVQAEESGKEYNIGPSKFSVPKLSGTEYYYSIWGESTSAMTGGYAGTVKKVTGDDISQAKEALTKELLAEAIASLKNKLSAEDVLLDNALVSEVVEATSNVNQNTVVEKFTEQARVKVSALVFKKHDVEKFVKSIAADNLPEEKDFLEKTLDIAYELESADMKKGLEVLNLQASIQTYYRIETTDLIDLFASKSAEQIKQIVVSRYSDKISETKVKFWPFWVNKAPKDKDKININLNFQ